VSRPRKDRPCPSCPRSSPCAEGCAGPNSVGCSPAVKHDTHKQAKACGLGRLAERLTADSWQQVAHRAGHVNVRRGSAGVELPQQLFGALPAPGWWGADRAGSDCGSAGAAAPAAAAPAATPTAAPAAKKAAAAAAKKSGGGGERGRIMIFTAAPMPGAPPASASGHAHCACSCGSRRAGPGHLGVTKD